ncbi:MAG: hypothetical protein U0746_07380 [Gemmataceae bacterium]
MLRYSRWLAAATLCAFAAVTSAAPVTGVSADSPLSAVPAQAPIVIHVRGVERVKERLNAMLKEAVPDFAPIIGALAESKLTDLLNGRSFAGVEKTGPIFVALLEMPAGDADPAVAVIAKVTKYADFRDGMLVDDEKKSVKSDPAGFEKATVKDKDFYFLNKGAYAVMTPSKDVATLMMKPQPGLDGKLSADLAKKLTDNDLSVYVNMAAVNKTYGDSIKEGKDQFLALLDGVGGQIDKAQLESAKAVYSSIFQLIEDGKAFVIGVDFKPDGLAITLNTQVGSDTKTNELLKDVRPALLDEFGKLGSGYTTYSASQFGPAMLKRMSSMAYGMVPEGAGRKAVEAAAEQMIAAGSLASYSSTNFPSQGLSVQSFKDPAKAVAAHVKMLEAIADGGVFQNAPTKGKPEIKADALDYKGFKLTYSRIVWDIDKMVEKVPNANDDTKEAMKKVLGSDVKTWFGTDGKLFISATAKDEAAAKAIIDAYLSGTKTLGSEAAYAVTRKNLPERASLIMLADANKFTQTMGDYMLKMIQSAPLPIAVPKGIKPVQGKTSFLGFALTMQPENGGIDLFLPTTAVQEIRKVIESAMADQ